MVEGSVTSGLTARIVMRRSERLSLDIDLTIQPGETLALLGPNGAGKTTIVNVLAGLLPIDSGHISVDDVVVDEPSSGTFVDAEDRDIGVVFQDYLLFPHLTIVDNVAFGLRSRGVSRQEAHAVGTVWLGRVGLAGFEALRPHELSGGQAQRVALARALATGPRALLLDEPLAALDVTVRGELRHLLRSHLAEFEGPKLLITHDPTDAFLLGDRIAIVEGGAITQAGDTDELRLRPLTPYAADLAGANLYSGVAAHGRVQIGGHSLQVADEGIEGPVLVTIAPAAVAVHKHPPGGSPRNAWQTVVERFEPLGSRVRLLTGAPLPITVELTEDARTEMGLDQGSSIWVAVKATEITVEPNANG
jgi:molybdate transport system ATP-binding protein